MGKLKLSLTLLCINANRTFCMTLSSKNNYKIRFFLRHTFQVIKVAGQRI